MMAAGECEREEDRTSKLVGVFAHLSICRACVLALDRVVADFPGADCV